MLCTQGCFTSGLDPLPLMGHSRIRAPITEQGGNFGQPSAETSQGHQGQGLGKGRAVPGALGSPCPPLGLLAGQQLFPSRKHQGMCHGRRSNAAGVRREPQPSSECKPKGLGLTPFLSLLHPCSRLSFPMSVHHG